MRLRIQRTKGPFARYRIVDRGKTKTRYYTGDHTIPEAVWSDDPKQSLLYRSEMLADLDLDTLESGGLPEGRRGVVGEIPALYELFGDLEGDDES